jgi:hypothetical protein
VLPIGLLERLDPVEVDVREFVPLLLVEFDPRALALRGHRLARDGLLERRVLVPLLVAEDEPSVTGLRLVSVDPLDPDFLLHAKFFPVELVP